MQELISDKFYTVLKQRYDELLLDYVLLSFEEEYAEDRTHREAVKAAINVLSNRVRVGNSLNHPQFYIDEEKMECTECNVLDFFYEDNNGWIITSEYTGYRQTPKHMNYWLAFSQPPYGVPYTKEDFRKLNSLLFPEYCRNDLIIYSWNDDFSNYFDDGKEWWGTALWSIYDKNMQRFVVIGASLTD